ncbi:MULTISPECIES: aldose epimerase family protein [Asticcacaulis]|uniref:aldose epimerase family protein n=1 Tax=Asticcacaulis TaxID=76890 RepID=UPI001AE1D056|nr:MULTISPECIES: aldose epimerase family protein [Asticcacaulis]MBP2161244.1 aldose 1-epimerase [Asticcacaulis solisilvae]MDR6802289.1 aldose 1-epimerase [Asticcacaulis sp. BE141]
MTSRRFVFDHLPYGREIEAVTLQSSRLSATILAYGATLQSLMVPDRDGAMKDVVLGHDTLKPYIEQPDYLGVTVGRYANRIAGGRFALEGKTYQLTRNDGDNSLHGGLQGFDKIDWTIDAVGDDYVRMSRVSPDGEQGYPGELTVAVTFTLSDTDLRIDYEATTDAPTIINLTNHALFNFGSGLDAELTLAADAYTPIDGTLIPTGELRDVTGTVFDFRAGRRLNDGVRRADDAQVAIGRGYDHNFVLRGGKTAEPKQAARLFDQSTGIGLDILTTEPGIQLYTGNFLIGTLPGKGGILYRQGDGIALEAQNFPDAPNQPEFPNPVLRPGETYRQTTIHRFFTR